MSECVCVCALSHGPCGHWLAALLQLRLGSGGGLASGAWWVRGFWLPRDCLASAADMWPNTETPLAPACSHTGSGSWTRRQLEWQLAEALQGRRGAGFRV